MKFKLILQFAKVLALASVRAQRMKGSVPTGFAKSPKLNIILGAVAFLGTTFLVTYFGGAFLRELDSSDFILQLFVFLPSLMTLAAIMYGLLFEFSQSSSAGSSDIINWLPIHATEFVLASVLSMLYFLAPLFGIVYGATLGLSLSANALDVGLLTLALSTLGMLLGAFILEIVRAITNRVSSTFYKRSGRSAVIIRMLAFIAMFVAFMLISNINFLFFILNQFVGGIESAWFVPLLWPSMVLISYLSKSALHVIIYLLLSTALAASILLASVKLREKYWVPAPFAIKLESSKPYTPKKGFLGSLGFSAAESAVIKKDFRGLTRRKEMIVWIAVPLSISVISIFSTQSALDNPSNIVDQLITFWGPLMGVFMLAFYMSLTSIGQEGSAFLNLMIVPLNRKELARAKLAPALILSVCGLTAVTILMQLVVQPQLETLIAISVTMFAVLFECTFIGLAVGSRFPDFTEVPRARFVEQKGVWLGMLIITACVGVTFMPLAIWLFPLFGHFPVFVAPVLSAIICVLVCYASYRATLNSLQALTQQS